MLRRLLKNLAGGSDQFPVRQASPLDAAEQERHRAIFGEWEDLPRNPPGWSILDDDSPRGRGFVPLAEAARRMRLTEAEVIDGCLRGHLEYVGGGSTLLVRPAVVTVLGARRADPPTPREAA